MPFSALFPLALRAPLLFLLLKFQIGIFSSLIRGGIRRIATVSGRGSAR